MVEFKLPDVGEGIHEAEIANWLVKVGDTVKQDQPILEIQTDKALVEIPSPVAGTVAEIRVQQGQVAHLGDVIIVFEADSGATNGQAAAPAAEPAPAATPAPAAATALKPGLAGPGQRVLAAPAVRKLARELGVDLSQVPGSAEAGRILIEDVKKFAAQPAPAPEPKPEPEPESVVPPAAAPVIATGEELIEREPLHGLRRRIAERMEEAWRVPHVTSFAEVEVTKLVKLRRSLKPLAEQQGARLTYLPFIIKAVVKALQECPHFNASLDMTNQEILLRRYYHIGIATAIPAGLVVPVVRHADQLSLLQLSRELTRLGELARERRLSPAELSGSTFSITNFGSFRAGQGTPIINPPEVAILGTGRIADKPVARKGKVKVRPVLPLALSYDHRLLDGAAAADFLGRVMALLANPKRLILEL